MIGDTGDGGDRGGGLEVMTGGAGRGGGGGSDLSEVDECTDAGLVGVTLGVSNRDGDGAEDFPPLRFRGRGGGGFGLDARSLARR